MNYKKRPEEQPKIEKWRKAVVNVNKERKKQGLPSLKDELFQLNPPLTPEQEEKIPPVYLDMLTFSKKIVNEQWAIELAKRLITWVHTTPDAIKINEFLVSQGIPREAFDNFMLRYKILKDANKYVREVLGNIRERKVLTGDWETNPGMFMMGVYDPDWHNEMLRRDDVKLKQNKTSAEDLTEILKIVLHQTPHTEEVARSLLEKGKNVIESGVVDSDITTSTKDISFKNKA